MRQIIAKGLVRLAMAVEPIVVNLTTSGRGVIQVVTVENAFANPLPVEIRVEELSLEADGVKGTGKARQFFSSLLEGDDPERQCAVSGRAAVEYLLQAIHRRHVVLYDQRVQRPLLNAPARAESGYKSATGGSPRRRPPRKGASG